MGGACSPACMGQGGARTPAPARGGLHGAERAGSWLAEQRGRAVPVTVARKRIRKGTTHLHRLALADGAGEHAAKSQEALLSRMGGARLAWQPVGRGWGGPERGGSSWLGKEGRALMQGAVTGRTKCTRTSHPQAADRLHA